MNALLSIRPKYIELMASGEKQYEFRKSVFRNRNIGRVYMYATRPVGRIVGSFRVGRIIEDHPQRLWEQLKDVSGLSEDEFFAYFGQCNKGYAIKIESLDCMANPIDPRDLDAAFVAPQSFCYLAADF
jgi:type I restriction enzyme, S subunit